MPLPTISKPATLYAGQGPSEDAVRQRIAALKARKPAATHLTMASTSTQPNRSGS